MYPYAATQLSERSRSLLDLARLLVDLVPSDEFPDVRCHELARAIGGVLGVTHADGHFGHVEHTWLLPETGVILDPYFPGVLPQCVLIDAFGLHPLTALYRPDVPRDDIDQELVARLRAVFGE